MNLELAPMNPDQIVKIAAIASSIVTVFVTVALFVVREFIEARRRKRQAATVLALYGYSAFRALERSSRGKLPFTMKDVLESVRDIVHVATARELLSAIDATMYALEQSDTPSVLPARDERRRLARFLKSALESHAQSLGLPHESLEQLGQPINET